LCGEWQANGVHAQEQPGEGGFKEDFVLHFDDSRGMLVGGNLPEATESFVIQNVKAHSTVHSISFEQKYEDNTVTRWEFK